MGGGQFVWLATEVIHPAEWDSEFGRMVSEAAVGYVTYIGAPFPLSADMLHFVEVRVWVEEE